MANLEKLQPNSQTTEYIPVSDSFSASLEVQGYFQFKLRTPEHEAQQKRAYWSLGAHPEKSGKFFRITFSGNWTQAEKETIVADVKTIIAANQTK